MQSVFNNSYYFELCEASNLTVLNDDQLGNDAAHSFIAREITKLKNYKCEECENF